MIDHYDSKNPKSSQLLHIKSYLSQMSGKRRSKTFREEHIMS